MQQESGQKELEQLKERSAQIEQDTKKARQRIVQLEGAVAALEEQTQSKTQGQSDTAQRAQKLSQELAELNNQRAALEAERETGAASLTQLEQLLAELAGDRDQSQALIGSYEEKNTAYAAQIKEKEGQLDGLRRENQQRAEEISRLNRQRMELEGGRVQADRDARSCNEELLRMEGEVSRLEQKKTTAALEEAVHMAQLLSDAGFDVALYGKEGQVCFQRDLKD